MTILENINIETEPGEVWREYPYKQTKYNGKVFVSNIGRIKVMGRKMKHEPRKNKQPRTNRGGNNDYICKQHTSIEGYCIVNLFGKSMKVHRMVCETFYLKSNDDLVVNHIDCNKTNNNVTNLEWCTRKHNAKHAWDNDLIHKRGLENHKGENHSGSKLTEIRVRVIRKLNGKIFSDSKMGQLYGVCREAIRDIRLHKRWKHV